MHGIDWLIVIVPSVLILWLAIYAKKKHNPTEFKDVPMITDLERMIPATPPRAAEPASKKKREDV